MLIFIQNAIVFRQDSETFGFITPRKRWTTLLSTFPIAGRRIVPTNNRRVVTAPASVRLYALPIDSWYGLPRKVLQNDLHVFEDHQVSFMRNYRKVNIGVIPELSGKKHGDAAWLRIQIDFDGLLDPAFGIAMTKQGVRPKKYALDIIHGVIKEDVKRIREKTAAFGRNIAKSRSKTQLMDAERQANETDALLGKPLVVPAATTEEERKILEANLRASAITLKRDDESDGEAYERLSKSKYVICFKHDEYWPFYKVDYQYGKVILSINTAHAFYTKIYKPLENLTISKPTNSDEEGDSHQPAAEQLLISLQLLLLSLARTQSAMLKGDDRDNYRAMLQVFQREWSDNLNTQLTIG